MQTGGEAGEQPCRKRSESELMAITIQVSSKAWQPEGPTVNLACIRHSITSQLKETAALLWSHLRDCLGHLNRRTSDYFSVLRTLTRTVKGLKGKIYQVT